ncbi:hypothetical protein BGX26_007379, partial [Mortierella sp. AD094]
GEELYPRVRLEENVTVLELPECLLPALCPGIYKDPCAEPTLWGSQERVWEMLLEMGRGAEPKSKDEKAKLAVLTIINNLYETI